MPYHELKQEQSLRLAARQKIGFHSHFSQRQLMQLAPHPALMSHDPPGLFPPASQGISSAGLLCRLGCCSASLHHAAPRMVTAGWNKEPRGMNQSAATTQRGGPSAGMQPKDSRTHFRLSWFSLLGQDSAVNALGIFQ